MVFFSARSISLVPTRCLYLCLASCLVLFFLPSPLPRAEGSLGSLCAHGAGNFNYFIDLRPHAVVDSHHPINEVSQLIAVPVADRLKDTFAYFLK
jgi:hypothetical protein